MEIDSCSNLLFSPCLGLVEHCHVNANLKVAPFEPDRALIGLAVLGIMLHEWIKKLPHNSFVTIVFSAA